MNLATNFKKLRKELNLEQEQIAKELDTQNNHLSNYYYKKI